MADTEQHPQAMEAHSRPAAHLATAPAVAGVLLGGCEGKGRWARSPAIGVAADKRLEHMAS